jgi:hypothetical protein
MGMLGVRFEHSQNAVRQAHRVKRFAAALNIFIGRPSIAR